MPQKNIFATLKALTEVDYRAEHAGGFNLASPVTKKVVFMGVTQAQVTAGLTLIPAIPGQKIMITDFWVRFNSTWDTLTNIIVRDTASSPVAVLTIVEAQMDAATIHTPAVGTHTLGAGFLVPLTLDKAVQVIATGTVEGGGTVDIVLEYQIED